MWLSASYTDGRIIIYYVVTDKTYNDIIIIVL